MDTAIKVSNLSYHYQDGTEALRDIFFTVPRGKRVVLMGHNGAGKSTLLLHFNGIFLPQQGTVEVLGIPVSEENENRVRQLVGIVFQDPDDQVFSSNVWDDVAFGPINMGLSKEEVKNRVAEALQILGIDSLRNHAPYQLSYGQKKRVAIAGVLAMAPEIIIFDEPMAFLDPRGQESLLNILHNFHRQGKTLIVATHDVDFAANWADQVVILKEGTVFADGGVELLADAELVAEAGLRQPVITRLFAEVLGKETDLPVTFDQGKELLKALIDKHKSF
ncbi:MAG: ATP-binding cassette domain-containing protein [Thermoanaerobacteraceae bacterium]|nr:ATP-binding cassette domain-containing protein [Thermoanaerobacteraceae bacterium]